MKTYKQFINESISISQYKEHAYTNKRRRFNKDRYNDIFQKYKELYSGNRTATRIYLPLIIQDTINYVKDEIIDFLKEHDYEVVDYFKNLCKHKKGTNNTKIAAVLTRLKKISLLKKFNEDPERKAGKNDELSVCISRHPFDIIGSDTDRDWTNCLTLPISEKNPRLIKLKAELSDLLSKYNPKDTSDDSVVLGAEIDLLKKKINAHTSVGMNVKSLKYDIKEGALVAYLIKKDDLNIKNPLSVLNIKPYVKNKEIYLRACNKSYSASGAENVNFKNTVINWLDEINIDKIGIFEIAPNVYPDENSVRLFIGGRTFQDYININKITPLRTQVFCIGEQISSLNGIEKFNELKSLSLEENELKNLKGIENCKELEYLNLNKNKIKNIDNIKELYNLKSLDLSDNDITDLTPLKDLINLNTLSIKNNPNLKSLNGLENLNKLKNLSISSCVINDLSPLKDLKNLKLLSCANNRITTLEPVSNIENLNIISENNPLK